MQGKNDNSYVYVSNDSTNVKLKKSESDNISYQEIMFAKCLKEEVAKITNVRYEDIEYLKNRRFFDFIP
jgi:hypothetical protein